MLYTGRICLFLVGLDKIADIVAVDEEMLIIVCVRCNGLIDSVLSVCPAWEGRQGNLVFC